jgi:anti-sigma factor RsiW
MKCQDLLQLLNEYVDGTLDPSFCEEFERHMAGCDPCQIVVDNIRKTITLYKAGQPSELSAPFRDQLHALLRDRWELTRPKND